MIYQKCKHCGMEWHGFKLTHCPYCKKPTGYEMPDLQTAMKQRSFKKMVLDMMRESGHGRIAHLAIHAKKRKTRKKNLHRAFRIPEKEEWQW